MEQDQLREVMKNDWNQSEEHASSMEDWRKTRTGLHANWNHRNPAFRAGYDKIDWRAKGERGHG